MSITVVAPSLYHGCLKGQGRCGEGELREADTLASTILANDREPAIYRRRDNIFSRAKDAAGPKTVQTEIHGGKGLNSDSYVGSSDDYRILSPEPAIDSGYGRGDGKGSGHGGGDGSGHG
ncbi:hypothetical protein SCUP515_00805 [Seiridium cupressi]